MDVFELLEFESIVKIEVTPYLEALGPILEQNLGITRKWWVIWVRRRLYRVSL